MREPERVPTLVTLRVVPLQLTLPGLDRPGCVLLSCDFGDEERDLRDGRQWLESAISYCLWRSGDRWRKLHRGGDRWSSSRWEYLEAVRLLCSLLYAPDKSAAPAVPQLVLPALDVSEPAYSPKELKLSEKPVRWLVDELQKADPRYTMRRSLLHMRRAKLARLLVRAWADSSKAQSERRRA